MGDIEVTSDAVSGKLAELFNNQANIDANSERLGGMGESLKTQDIATSVVNVASGIGQLAFA